MKKLHFLFLLLAFPVLLHAQTCLQPFNVTSWFTGSLNVRISPDASRFWVLGNSGPTTNSNSNGTFIFSGNVYIYKFTGNGVTYTTFNPAITYASLPSDFTANNGFFYSSGANSSYDIKYIDSSGNMVSVANATGFIDIPIFSRIAGAPNKMIARIGYTTNQAVILDATTNTPTATVITLPGPTSYAADYNNFIPAIAASATDNRIYYSAYDGNNNYFIAPYVRSSVRACDFSGAIANGWSDVVIQRGATAIIAVRPSDGMVFVRTNQNGNHRAVHGVVIFDKNGTLATDMNMADLSLVGNLSATPDSRFEFDANGNIYANNFLSTSPTAHNGCGMMKFDPKGNLDMGFMRNAWNSYGISLSNSAASFCMADNGLIIKCGHGTYATDGWDEYSININHINTNNEFPDTITGSSTAYSYIPANIGFYGTYPLFSNSSNSLYNSLQFMFNNGKLVRPGMTQSDINNNCGLAATYILPTLTAAAGTIDCNGLAFMQTPVQGTPSILVLKVPITVTSAGMFTPITVSGSGMTLQNPNEVFNTTSTGSVDFYVTLKYDGTTALGSFTINVTNAGSCTVNLADNTKSNSSVINIWTPQNCTYKVLGPVVK